MNFYDDSGYDNVYENDDFVTFQAFDDTELLEALKLQTEKLEQLETIVENQSAALEASQEHYEMLLAHIEAQGAKIAEMNQYTAYIFVTVLAFLLYRILILIVNQNIDKIQSLPVILFIVSAAKEQIVSQSLSTTFSRV